EVKTRAARALVAGEAAVDSDKQRELSGMARDYLRRVQPMPAVRCDVLSIYVEAGGGVGDMTLFKDAFSLS
ncbi:MAG TPA: YraN family protein, partial [Terriglobales bacterium]|nr:YraN family protein [Terriglobales bacterium]